LKPVVECIIDFKWESYGRGFFLWSTVVSSILSINYSFYSVYSLALPFMSKVIWTVVIALNASPLILHEAMEIISTIRRRRFFSYIANYWNVVDLVTYEGLIAILVLRLLHPYHSGTYIISGSVAKVLWLKLLYYFMAFVPLAHWSE